MLQKLTGVLFFLGIGSYAVKVKPITRILHNMTKDH